MKEREQSAEKHAMHEWLQEIRQPLLRYCLQVTGLRWEAEDILQDTIIRLLMVGAARPEQEIGFRYACRTARNLWIDRCRREKRAAVFAQCDAAQLEIDGSRSQQGGSGMKSGSLHAHANDGMTHAAMDVREHLEELAWRLPPKPFVILLLMEVFDFTAKETAAWIGGTEVAVQVALSRARSRLRLLRGTGSGVDSTDGKVAAAAGRATGPFFEAVLEAFRRRQPSAIQEAYLALVLSGGHLRGIRAMGGKLYFTFQDPNGHMLMVTS